MISCGAKKGETFSVGHVEGSNAAYVIREGAFVLENGNYGSLRVLAVVRAAAGKGLFLRFNIYTFADGSTILSTSQPGTFWPDLEGKVAGIQKGRVK